MPAEQNRARGGKGRARDAFSPSDARSRQRYCGSPDIRDHVCMPNTLHEGRFLRLRDDDGWEFAERTQGTGVVCIVAVDGDHVILTSEYRSPVRATVTSLPAGLIDVGESAIEAALRELR